MIAIRLEAAGQLELPAAGVSMGKSWAQADTLQVIARTKQPPGWGDVILYRTAGNLIAHRVVKRVVRNGAVWWITKGDGYYTPDRIPVPDADVLGVVTAYSVSGNRATFTMGRRIAGVFHACVGRIGLLVWPPLWKQTD